MHQQNRLLRWHIIWTTWSTAATCWRTRAIDWRTDRKESWKLEKSEWFQWCWLLISDCWLLTTTTEKSSLFLSSSALDSSFNSSKASRVSSLILEVINRFHEKESKTWPGCTARHTLQPISLLLSFKGFHENQFSPSKYLENISIKKSQKHLLH